MAFVQYRPPSRREMNDTRKLDGLQDPSEGDGGSGVEGVSPSDIDETYNPGELELPKEAEPPTECQGCSQPPAPREWYMLGEIHMLGVTTLLGLLILVLVVLQRK